jgi:hypothetical protein
MGKTGLVWLVVCLLPAALAAGLYGLVGRRAAPVPHRLPPDLVSKPHSRAAGPETRRANPNLALRYRKPS